MDTERMMEMVVLYYKKSPNEVIRITIFDFSGIISRKSREKCRFFAIFDLGWVVFDGPSMEAWV
jgi:hypothetical protein